MKFKIFAALRWRNRMIIAALVLLLVVGSSVMMLINHFREQMFHHYLVELIRPMESLINNQIRHNMKYHAPDHFQTLLEEMEVSEEIRWVNVLDREYKIVFSNNPANIGKYRPPPPRKVHEVLGGDELFITTPKDSLALIQVIAGVHNAPECYPCHGESNVHNGFIEVGVTNTAERSIEVLLLQYDFLTFFAFMVLVSTIIFFVHHRFFQRPFNEIKKAIKAIEDGDLSTRVEINTPGELTILANHINAMVARIKNHQEELDRLHQEQIDRAGQLATVGELAASVAHEIKNPIAGIRNALEIIVEQYGRSTEKPIIDEMFMQIDRVTNTIRDLLIFARPQEPKYSPIELQDVIEKAVSLHRNKMEKENIKLVEDFPSEPLEIEGDSELLRRVFVNLLLNAFQAVEGVKDGLITIRARKDIIRNRIKIEFIDNGKGMAPEVREKVFKPFFTTKHKGTGLGLSLSLSIIRKHGGNITCQSELNVGTTFTVELPVHQSANK
jgi:signal transduction histidine kinase